MKKILIVSVVLFVIIIQTDVAQAGFFRDLFSKKNVVIVEPAKIVKPINKLDLDKRIKIVEQIMAGVYSGTEDVAINFSEKELQSLFLPWVNRNIKSNPKFASSSVDSLIFPDGAVEVRGVISWLIKDKIMIRIVPSADNGKLKLDINKVQVSWFVLPKSVVNKLLDNLKIKSEDLIRPLPHFELKNLLIKDGEINIEGRYKK